MNFLTVDPFKESIWYSPTTGYILTAAQIFCAALNKDIMHVMDSENDFGVMGRIELTLSLKLDHYEFIGYV